LNSQGRTFYVIKQLAIVVESNNYLHSHVKEENDKLEKFWGEKQAKRPNQNKYDYCP